MSDNEYFVKRCAVFDLVMLWAARGIPRVARRKVRKVNGSERTRGCKVRI
jgi:hypothetical protein